MALVAWLKSSGQKRGITAVFLRLSLRLEKMPYSPNRSTSSCSLEVVLRTRNDEDLDLEVVEIEGKGRGVLARKNFTKGEPVVEYKGKVVTVKEGEKKMRKLSPNVANIMISETFSGSRCSQSFCVDATTETGRFGRLVNHSYKSPNIQIKVATS